MQKLAKLGLLLLFVFCSQSLVSPVCADDPPEVNQIAQTAIAAQNANDFEIAAEQWQRIVSEYPNSSQIGVALYQAGYCYSKTGNYAKAADLLQQSISKLDPSKSVSIAQAYLFLGHSQAQLGRELKDENKAEANKLLTTATESFAAVLKRFPKFEDADQALYLQGEAYEALGRLDDATGSYSRMLELDDPEFKLDALYGLGFIYGKQGKYADALEMYSKFEVEGKTHQNFNEVRYHSALAMTELAKAAQNIDDAPRAKELLTQAAEKFESVYLSRDPNWAAQARFEQGIALSRLGRYAESAPVFESVVQIPGSKLVDQARVYAGRDFMRSGNGNSAAQLLEKSVAVPSKFAPLGAHWLAQFYLKSNQAEQAYATASEWIEKTENENLRLPLMLDKADAAYETKKRIAESKDLYLQIANQYPEHELAPSALYNASYAAMKSGNLTDALALTKKFRDAYSGSDYLLDVLEVETDSYLMSDEPALAQQSSQLLVDSFAGHPKNGQWKLNVGLALYMQKKYQDSIAQLEPVVDRLELRDKKAEALHWIGCSHHKLGDAKNAIAHLSRSFETSDSWRLADETLLRLSQSYFANSQPQLAQQTTQQLVDSFPGSKRIAEASYRLGEFEYEAGNYDASLTNYAAVIDKFEESEFAPYALFGIGWSYLQKGDFNFAVESFGKLAEMFPKHPLASQMLIGRASANRQQGKIDDAIADVKQFLATDPVDSKHQEALYEMGLAQIAKQDWPEVIGAFEKLLELAPESNLADRFHYELAWANKSNKNLDAALTHFQTIAQKFPESSLAAESNVHVGQSANDQGNFQKAIEHFDTAAKKSTDASITEKALYGLAWSNYKLKDFDAALAAFQKQLEQFPDGMFKADAMFMVSESLYENKNYGEALKKYRVAKPVIETSKTVKPSLKILTNLHGAQSANLAGEHQLAIEFAESLLVDDVNKQVQQDAQMEIGDAYRALNDPNKALEAYMAASTHLGTTGARSMCMIGEIFFDQKQFADAINRFKLVRYGFGGNQAVDEIKQWQAFACYEAGRCNMVQISLPDNSEAVKRKFVEESRKHFQYLVENFPNDKLAPEANRQLKKLEAVEL